MTLTPNGVGVIFILRRIKMNRGFNETEILKLTNLGNRCKSFRQQLGISAYAVSNQVGYKPANIYKFEKGELNNALILLWYVERGFKL